MIARNEYGFLPHFPFPTVAGRLLSGDMNETDDKDTMMLMKIMMARNIILERYKFVSIRVPFLFLSYSHLPPSLPKAQDSSLE